MLFYIISGDLRPNKLQQAAVGRAGRILGLMKRNFSCLRMIGTNFVL